MSSYQEKMTRHTQKQQMQLKIQSQHLNQSGQECRNYDGYFKNNYEEGFEWIDNRQEQMDNVSRDMNILEKENARQKNKQKYPQLYQK